MPLNKDKIQIKTCKFHLACLCIILTLVVNRATALDNDCLTLHVIETPPLGYIDEQGNTVGVHWDKLTALAEFSGICINKVILPYPRIWRSIEVGDHDGGIIFRSTSRDHLVKYAAKIRHIKTIAVAVNGTTIKDYNDLKHLTIGKMRGTHVSPRFDNDENIDKFDLKNTEQAAKMLQLGRIDAIAGSALVLIYQLNKLNLLHKVDLMNKVVLGEKVQWLQLSVHSQHLDKIPKLRDAVEQLHQNGTFDNIMTKYYGPKWKIINN